MMSFWKFLPSGQFSTIVGSIAFAGGLIVAAQYVTRPHTNPPQVAVAPVTQSDSDWQAKLEAIQAEAPGLPETPSANVVSSLLEGAKSSNYTETAARSLLINLSDAQSQGLGNDIPTQEKLIADAAGLVPSPKAKKTYTSGDISTVTDSKEAQKVYGNNMIEVLGRHTGATSDATLYVIAKATDNNDPAALGALSGIQAEYAALVVELAAVKTPVTLVPLQVQILNSLALTAATFDDMKVVFSDPLRGLQGIQQYQLQLGAVGRVFTTVAQILNKNGILFNKDEPGAAWAVFIST